MENRQDPRIAVRPSSIHGLGIFAVEPIPRGTLLLHLDDSRVVDSDHPLRTTDNESAIHCDYLPDGTVVLMQTPERYINHSCEPNAYVYSVNRERFVLTMRDVDAREEILFDYALNAVDGDEWQCLCGSPNCRGKHKCDFFMLPIARQLEYLPYLDPWFASTHTSRIQGLLESSA